MSYFNEYLPVSEYQFPVVSGWWRPLVWHQPQSVCSPARSSSPPAAVSVPPAPLVSYHEKSSPQIVLLHPHLPDSVVHWSGHSTPNNKLSIYNFCFFIVLLSMVRQWPFDIIGEGVFQKRGRRLGEFAFGQNIVWLGPCFRVFSIYICLIEWKNNCGALHCTTKSGSIYMGKNGGGGSTKTIQPNPLQKQLVAA